MTPMSRPTDRSWTVARLKCKVGGCSSHWSWSQQRLKILKLTLLSSLKDEVVCFPLYSVSTQEDFLIHCYARTTHLTCRSAPEEGNIYYQLFKKINCFIVCID